MYTLSSPLPVYSCHVVPLCSMSGSLTVKDNKLNSKKKKKKMPTLPYSSDSIVFEIHYQGYIETIEWDQIPSNYANPI